MLARPPEDIDLLQYLHTNRLGSGFEQTGIEESFGPDKTLALTDASQGHNSYVVHLITHSLNNG